MTNNEIILRSAVGAGIITLEQMENKEEFERIFKSGKLTLHTFASWKSRGYKVKKGEHAKLVTSLWVPKALKFENENGEEVDTSRMYLRKSFLFDYTQVEPCKAR